MSLIDEKLETLIAVANHKNFTKAALELGLTQPAVSMHMHRLEEELNIKLFLKKKGELVLSSEGEIVFLYAKRLMALSEKLALRLKDAKRNLKNLRIGITHTQESGQMVEVLSKLATKDNNLSITIITDTIKNLYDKLENFEIDLAIIEARPTQPNFNYMMIDTDYLVCVVSPTHPLAKKMVVTINDLKHEHLILRLPSSATRTLFEASLESINETIDDFDVTVEVDSISTIKELVSKNIGVSILAKGTCTKEIRKKKLVLLPIENLNMVRETNIVYHHSFIYTDILANITTIYNEIVKNHNE